MPTNREDLIRATVQVRAALAPQAFIPALTHLRFDEDGVTAYNDISALSVALEHDLDCCVPGDLFIKALNGFAAKDVKVSPSKDSAVTLTSGKGKIKLPTLELRDFPFTWPDFAKADVITFSDEMLKAVQRCLVSVGTNANHPAQMGVTMEDDAGFALFFSTDNFTITRVATNSKISLPAEAPVILPTFFCEQMLSLSKAYPEEELAVYLLDGGLLLVVGDEVARLYSRQLVDLVPLDFPAIIRKHVTSIDKLEKSLSTIPAGWEDALNRSLLVLSAAVEKQVKLTMISTGLNLEAKSDYGEHDEDLVWNDQFGFDKPVHINPQMVLRGSAMATHLFFGKTVLVLASKDASLIHLVAYYNGK